MFVNNQIDRPSPPLKPYGMMALILKLLGDSSGDISYGSLALTSFARRMPL